MHSRIHTDPKQFSCKLCEKTFSNTRYLRNHLKTHDKVKKTVKSICPKTSVKNRSGGKSSVVELCQSIVRNTADGSELSTIEVNQVFLSKQKNGSSPAEQLLNSDYSNISSTANANHYIFKTYACGVCEKMFDVEEVFMEHCHHHYSENPLKNTFVEFFDLHLLNYFPRGQIASTSLTDNFVDQS